MNWAEDRTEFLAKERAFDKLRPIARRQTLRVMDALQAAGVDLSVVSSVMSHAYGTALMFAALDRNEKAATLNPKLEAQRAIVIAITRELGIEGKKSKEMYSYTGALQVEWAEDPPRPEGTSWDDPAWTRARGLAHANSVRCSEYVPPTCRFVTKVRHVEACEAHDQEYTAVECGPDEAAA